MKYDANQIQLDRQSGMTIKEIAVKHDISVRTVHRVLSSDSPTLKQIENSSLSVVVDIIYSLAKRDNGITYGEEWKIITSTLKNYSGDIRKNIRRAVRAKAEKDGVKVLFVPNWLSTDNTTTPRESLDIMLGIAHELNERILEYVNDYMQMTGNKDRESVEQALLTYAVQGYGNTPFQSYCELIGGIVEELSEDV